LKVRLVVRLANLGGAGGRAATEDATTIESILQIVIIAGAGPKPVNQGRIGFVAGLQKSEFVRGIELILNLDVFNLLRRQRGRHDALSASRSGMNIIMMRESISAISGKYHFSRKSL
jgi:hypothetical protein